MRCDLNDKIYFYNCIMSWKWLDLSSILIFICCYCSLSGKYISINLHQSHCKSARTMPLQNTDCAEQYKNWWSKHFNHQTTTTTSDQSNWVHLAIKRRAVNLIRKTYSSALWACYKATSRNISTRLPRQSIFSIEEPPQVVRGDYIFSSHPLSCFERSAKTEDLHTGPFLS